MPEFGRWTGGGGDPSLNEIARADDFFEALAAKQPVYPADREEAELAFLLSGWRDDVREAPVTAPVGTGAAIDALEAGLSKSARGARRSFAVIGSVAAAVLCIGGFGTAVYGAGPGDSLYGMRTAMFGQPEVTRDEQVSLASAQLAQVQQLIDDGQWQAAQDKLVAVSTAVQGVGPVEQKQQLVEQWNALTYKVVEQNPTATLPPGEPLPVLPSSPLTWLPIPVIDGSSTSSSTSSSSMTSSSATSDSTTPESSTTDTSGTSATSPTSASETSGTPGTSPSESPVTTTPEAGTSTSATTSAPAPSSTATTTTATTTTTTATTTTTMLPTREPQAPQQTPTPASRPSQTVADVPASQPRMEPSTPAAPAPTPTTTTLLPPS
jgi:hypothetical protein